MGITVAISEGLTSESNKEAFSDHNLFTRLTTSCAIVLLPAPGGPARPTKYLYGIIEIIIQIRAEDTK